MTRTLVRPSRSDLDDRPLTHTLRKPRGRTGLTILQSPCLTNIDSRTIKGGKNSAYKGRAIDLRDVVRWSEDFFSVEEIEKIWEDDPEMEAIVTRPLTGDEMDFCVMAEQPLPFKRKIHNEQCLERLWGAIQDQLNLVLWVCAKGVQKTEKPTLVIIGDGEEATYISPDAEENADRKRPDHSGYMYNPANERKRGKVKLHNRIPGDAKLYRKLRREMLPPDGKLYRSALKNVEALKALSQIHGYMDQHEARYGYIVTDQELICFRRSSTGWGHLEIGPAIRHDVKPNRETGVLNSKYVLFYLHWKIANDDCPNTGWRLRSFGKMPSVPRPPCKVSKRVAYRPVILSKGRQVRTNVSSAKCKKNVTSVVV